MTTKRIFGSVLTALALVLFAPSISLAATTIGSYMSQGSTGADVTALQTFLSLDTTIYPEGLVTGYYGPLTAAAVTRFQARYGIDQVGVVGPITLGKINGLLASGGFGGSNTGGVVTTFGDVSAPYMSGESVSVSNNSATISWTTSEASQNRVMYSTSWPFLYATAASASDATQFDTQASVTITGLQPNTVYFFVPESVDANGNVMYTTAQNFTTAH
jgi:peptidoglycan hydrolase-like protein with peptidoglycan-binding domain